MNFTEVCIRRPVLAWMIMASTILFGLVSALRIGVSQMPDVDSPNVTVSLGWPGAAPEEIEHGIVEPLEESLAQVEGIQRIEAKARGEPVAVMPGLEFAVAGVYLHRGRLRAPIATTDLWVMVQPERGAGERALTPVANPPLAQLWGSQFHAVAEIDYHGFRMIHLQAGSPTSVAPAPADNGLPATPDAFVLAP